MDGADIVVDNKIILELKSVDVFHPTMEAQLINYLKVSGVPVGYLCRTKNHRLEKGGFWFCLEECGIFHY